MMDLGTIARLTAEATKRARAARMVPAVATDAQREAMASGQWSGFKFPFLGDHVPHGWTPDGEPFMVDTTGLDNSGGAMALDRLRQIVAAAPGAAWATVEHGQFQAYVQRFRRKYDARGANK